MNTDDQTLENCLAELLQRAYANEDMEVAEHLLRALEVVVRRSDRAGDVIDRLRGQAGIDQS